MKIGTSSNQGSYYGNMPSIRRVKQGTTLASQLCIDIRVCLEQEIHNIVVTVGRRNDKRGSVT